MKKKNLTRLIVILSLIMICAVLLILCMKESYNVTEISDDSARYNSYSVSNPVIEKEYIVTDEALLEYTGSATQIYRYFLLSVDIYNYGEIDRIIPRIAVRYSSGKYVNIEAVNYYDTSYSVSPGKNNAVIPPGTYQKVYYILEINEDNVGDGVLKIASKDIETEDGEFIPDCECKLP